MKINYKNFINNKLKASDFKITYVIHRVRRIKNGGINEKISNKIKKLSNSKKPIKEGEVSKILEKIEYLNSFYYEMSTTCDEVENFLRKSLNKIKNKRDCEIFVNRIITSNSFHILKKLLDEPKNGRLCFPQFKSLKHCQYWCNKNNIDIDVYEVYKKSN